MPRSGSRPFLLRASLLFPFVLPSVASARSVAPSSGYSTSITAHGLKVTLTLSKRTFADRSWPRRWSSFKMFEVPHAAGEALPSGEPARRGYAGQRGRLPACRAETRQVAMPQRGAHSAFTHHQGHLRGAFHRAQSRRQSGREVRRLTGKKGKHGPYFTVRTPPCTSASAPRRGRRRSSSAPSSRCAPGCSSPPVAARCSAPCTMPPPSLARTRRASPGRSVPSYRWKSPR